MQDATQQAITAIGEDDHPDADWELRPKLHASRLPAEAGALRRILLRPEIHDIMDRYAAANDRAVAWQSQYKWVGRLGLAAATLATVLGAIVLLFPDAPADGGSLRKAALAIQYLSIIVAFGASQWLIRKRPFDAWMKARADAEIARISLFDTVMASPEATRPGELPLLPLKLEYFRRYHLDVQTRFYGGRGREHLRATGASTFWTLLSFAITAISAAIAVVASLYIAADLGLPLPAGLVGFSQGLASPETTRLLLALGVIASALYGFAAARSFMNLDERNASRYLTNEENLKFLADTELPRARDAAVRNDEPAVAAFTARIQQLVSSEHKEWVLINDIAPKAGPPLAKKLGHLR